jgi:hypothetical protein
MNVASRVNAKTHYALGLGALVALWWCDAGWAPRAWRR